MFRVVFCLFVLTLATRGAAAQSAQSPSVLTPEQPARSLMLTTARRGAAHTFATPPDGFCTPLVPLAARPTRRAAYRYQSMGDNAWLPADPKPSFGTAAVVGAAALLSLATGQRNNDLSPRLGQYGPGYGYSYGAPLNGTAWNRATYPVLQPLRGGYSVGLPLR